MALAIITAPSSLSSFIRVTICWFSFCFSFLLLVFLFLSVCLLAPSFLCARQGYSFSVSLLAVSWNPIIVQEEAVEHSLAFDWTWGTRSGRPSKLSHTLTDRQTDRQREKSQTLCSLSWLFLGASTNEPNHQSRQSRLRFPSSPLLFFLCFFLLFFSVSFLVSWLCFSFRFSTFSSQKETLCQCIIRGEISFKFSFLFFRGVGWFNTRRISVHRWNCRSHLPIYSSVNHS